MRIAFYAPMKPPTHPTPSGDRRMARLLMEAWKKSGHVVELASRFRSYDKGDVNRQHRLKEIGQKLASRLIRRYRSLPAELRPNLWFTYHLYHKAPDWLGSTVAQGLGIPYIVAEASYAPKQKTGAWAMGHRATKDSLAKADRIIGFNPIDSECIKSLLQNPDQQVSLKPFINTTPYTEANREMQKHRIEVSKRFGLKMNAPWLLCVAMMRHDQKLLSYQLLAKALEPLLDRPWQLLIVGSGPAQEEVKKAMTPIEARICWLGNQTVEDLIAIYAGSDLFVWPAIKEAYGMVFLEALSAGLPVVAGNSAGVAGIVSNDKNGILVPLGDVQAFTSAVARLIEETALRDKMSIFASKDMAEYHNIEQMAGALDQISHQVTMGAYK